MLYYLGGLLSFWGPARLLQSYSVLIVIALYVGFFIVWKFLPKFYRFLPSDRGREFTLTAEAAKGKPTGSGSVFISMFVLLCFLLVPLTLQQYIILALTWLMMLTGFLDDRSSKGWGEYLKAFLDLVITVLASIVLALTIKGDSPAGKIYFWLPFVTNPVSVPVWLYIIVGTVILWASVNTTNCTDGVDGLSSTLVLFALITMGCIFYLILGHSEIAAYLLFPGHQNADVAKALIIQYFPHFTDFASWAVITFALAGVLLGYLWHNAYPSKVLMGDAGSRALGFYIGICVMLSGNPFLIFATSTMIFIDGGLGLVKVALKRFFHINIFSTVRFPLHDHVKKNHGWSPAQVLIKFMTLQLLISVALLGIFLKIR